MKLNTYEQNTLDNSVASRGDGFDFIVCGAGPSGSVVAARLAEDGNARVLLLEAGGDDSAETVTNPAQWPLNLGSSRDWGFIGERLPPKYAGASLGQPLLKGILWVPVPALRSNIVAG